MATTTPKIDYSSRDFLTIMAALKAHLKVKFPTTWKDFYESGMGQALCEVFAYCFTGDTKVSLVNGTEQTIESLVGKDPFWVYSYDRETKKIVPAKATAKKTRETIELIQVELDNGEKIRCTTNHPFMMRDGSYKLAVDLVAGDSLMPLYRKYADKGLPGYELILQPQENKWHFTHRQFAPVRVSKDCTIVHHKDYNKLNNCPDNFQWVTKAGHAVIHGRTPTLKERAVRSNNMKKLNELIRTEGTEERERFLAVMRSPHNRQIHSEKLSGENNPNYGNKWTDEEKQAESERKKAFYQSPEGAIAKATLSEQMKGKKQDPEVVARRAAAQRGLKKSPRTAEHNKNSSDAQKKYWNSLSPEEKARKRQKHVDYSVLHPHFHTLEIRTQMSQTRKEWWRQQKEQTNLQVAVNHKVVSVTILNKKEDVFCLEVPEYHNFALSAGVFVGNCFDVLSFATDYTANELYLETARDRRSILLLGRLMGYQLRTATSASVECVATLPGIVTNPVVVPAGTSVKSTDGVDFVTVEETTLQPAVVGAITFTQGVNQTDNFSSTGVAFQKFVLTQSSVVEDTVNVTVDGDQWDEVDSLAYSDGDTESFQVEYDEDGVATIMFGDGESGKVPPPASVITVTYRTGGGITGNITLNKINTVVTGNEQAPGYPPVTVAVVNSGERGAGGEDAETVNHAKLWIPAWVKSNNRAVTESDYDALANSFSDPIYGAPAFAKASLKQEIPELNTVVLSIWSRDYAGTITAPTQGLKDALETYFNNNGAGAVKMLCQHCEVEDGNIVYVDVLAQIKVSTDYASSDVVAAVNTAIDDFFSSASVIPGADFRISSLYQTIMGVAGVQYCIIGTIRASYKLTETIGLGTGVATQFSGTLTLEPGLEVVPGSVIVYYGTPATETLTDDALGHLLDSLGAVKGTIDYETGVITNATFASAPALGALVRAEYRYILDYQRGELEATGDGSTKKFKGITDYAPINPYDSTTGFKGIAFAAGSQVVRDDGNGALIGDVDPTGVNRIDYDTGGYDFTFALPPASGAEVRSTYMQILDTSSQDLPIDNDQICVKGTVSITTL